MKAFAEAFATNAMVWTSLFYSGHYIDRLRNQMVRHRPKEVCS